MIHNIYSKLLIKNITQRLLFMTLMIIFSTTYISCTRESDNFHSKIAVIKDAIVEMRTGFPAPDNPPAAPEEKKCHRAHQGLYNELVTCIEQQGDYVKICYENIIYGFDQDTKKVLNTFWMYKKHIKLINELESEVLQTIPHKLYAQEPTIVLIYPWQQFSVGTRFKRVPEHDTQSSWGIIRTDYDTNKILLDSIPHEYAIQEINQDPQSARNLFVTIINNLIDKVAQSGPEHVIPFVWGGSSFLQSYIKSGFYKKDGAWQREGKNNPYTGYDCSEFVMRMAQIAGIKFPWKTTTAIQLSKREFNNEDQLEEGDLIWAPGGHIVIVSNIEHNEIIRSSGYSSGYGCVHRITLNECFEDITTYDELLKRYYAHEAIKFKDKQGVSSQKAYHIKILKLLD